MEALQRLRTEVPSARAELVQLDLASLDSIASVAASELSTELGLNLLINNAGVMAPKQRKETQDGFELQLGTNVLGHFALTGLLLPALEKAAAAGGECPRVVTIASIAHKQGRINFEDLQSEMSYSPMGAYRQSKLADLMFAMELDRRLQRAGERMSRVMSVAAHPGVANTNLFQAGEYPPMELRVRRWLGVAIGALLNTQAGGAVPTLFAATATEVKRGGYYGPRGFQETRGGDVGPAIVAPQAQDRDAAARLWSECERLTGISLL